MKDDSLKFFLHKLKYFQDMYKQSTKESEKRYAFHQMDLYKKIIDHKIKETKKESKENTEVQKNKENIDKIKLNKYVYTNSTPKLDTFIPIYNNWVKKVAMTKSEGLY